MKAWLQFTKSTITCIVLLMSVDYSIAQSIIQEYVYPTGNIFKVVTLGAHLNDGKYDKAINSQLGIIGNDYFHPDTIGTAPAEEKRVIDKWYPITLDKVKRLSFKSTCVGVLRETYRRSPSRVARIVNPLIGEEADDDWNFEVIPQGDIIAKINMYEKKRNIIPSSVLYEIDIPEYFKDFFAKEKIYTPNVFTPVAAYGPLVTDQGHGPPYQVEIHPAEQIWWTKQTPEIISHYLISASDASGSFKNRDDYDANNILSTDPTWKGIWQHVPQESMRFHSLQAKRQKKLLLLMS